MKLILCFLCHDAVKAILHSPFDGPYKVVKRGDKTFVICKHDKNVTVSIDRLNPAFMVKDDNEIITSQEIPISNDNDNYVPNKEFSSRSKRSVRFPDRFQAGFNCMLTLLDYHDIYNLRRIIYDVLRIAYDI